MEDKIIINKKKEGEVKIGRRKYNQKQVMEVINFLKDIGFIVHPKEKDEIILRIKKLKNPKIIQKETWINPEIAYRWRFDFLEGATWSCNDQLNLYQIIEKYKERDL